MYCPACGVTVVEAERCPACDRDLGDDDRWSPAGAERRREAARDPADRPGLRRVSRLAVGSAVGLVALAAAGGLAAVPGDAAVALGTADPAVVAVAAAVLVSGGLLVRIGWRPALYGTTLLFAALLGLAVAALAPVGVVVFLAGTVAGVLAVRERRAAGRPGAVGPEAADGGRKRED
jgi:hypothetical protein